MMNKGTSSVKDVIPLILAKVVIILNSLIYVRSILDETGVSKEVKVWRGAP